MRRRDIARSVADGRQQLDRRESDAIIVGQVAFAMIIGEEGMTGGDGEGRGGGRCIWHTDICTRARPASYSLTYT